MKTTDDSKRMALAVCKKQEWELNHDADLLDVILKGLATKHNELGYFHCPCREESDDASLDKDIRCPCKYSWQDIKEYGQCFCGLFVSPQFNIEKKEAENIPERRPE